MDGCGTWILAVSQDKRLVVCEATRDQCPQKGRSVVYLQCVHSLYSPVLSVSCSQTD